MMSSHWTNNQRIGWREKLEETLVFSTTNRCFLRFPAVFPLYWDSRFFSSGGLINGLRPKKESAKNIEPAVINTTIVALLTPEFTNRSILLYAPPLPQLSTWLPTSTATESMFLPASPVCILRLSFAGRSNTTHRKVQNHTFFNLISLCQSWLSTAVPSGRPKQHCNAREFSHSLTAPGNLPVMSWCRSANICREGHASSTLLPSRAAVFSWESCTCDEKVFKVTSRQITANAQPLSFLCCDPLPKRFAFWQITDKPMKSPNRAKRHHMSMTT